MGAALHIVPPEERVRRMEAAESLANDPQAQAELALMARVRDGDREAVIGIVERYQDELIGFFYHLCWDQTVSEELAQDVFVRLYNARERWQPTARLRTWLYRIAHNLWIDHLRRKRSLVSIDAERGEEGMRLADVLEAAPQVDPDARERDAQIRDRVRGALAELPEGQREVFILANDQGMKYHDIAAVLGIPEGTVKSRMHHAVRFLRDELADLVEQGS
jgi:RNA polymerase sigma-70 factor (ECF subfamily)